MLPQNYLLITYSEAVAFISDTCYPAVHKTNMTELKMI